MCWIALVARCCGCFGPTTNNVEVSHRASLCYVLRMCVFVCERFLLACSLLSHTQCHIQLDSSLYWNPSSNTLLQNTETCINTSKHICHRHVSHLRRLQRNTFCKVYCSYAWAQGDTVETRHRATNPSFATTPTLPCAHECPHAHKAPLRTPPLKPW